MTKKAISIVLVITLLMVMLTACTPWQRFKDQITGVVNNSANTTEPTEDNPTDGTTPDDGGNGTTTTEPTNPDEISLVFVTDSITIEEGKDGRFEITHQGGGKLVWTSSNENVATVSANGVIHAKKVGTATITATVEGTDISDSGIVKVVEAEETEPTAPSVDKPTDPTDPTKPVEVTLTLNKTSISLEVGKSATLTASYNGTKNLSWSSSNSSVATVSNGKVTAVSAGTATITVSDGTKSAKCTVTVTKPVEPTDPPVEVTVKLNKTSLTLDVGDTATLTATTTGNGTLSWSSSNTSVATVSNGKVTAKAAGTAVITVSYGGKTAKCTVTVNKPAEPTNPPVEVKLSLNKTSLTLEVGDTSTITASYSGASGKPTWSSNNTSVATVDSNGKVTAKGAGTAVITVTYGGKNAQCVVTVNQPKPAEVKLSLNKTSVTLEVGGTATITATYSGASGSPSWSSSNNSVATVDSNGKVTAKGAGTAVITATYGGKNAQCTVTVNQPASQGPGTFTFTTARDTEVLVGGTLQMKWTYTGDIKDITFKSGNATILSVNSSGVVTGVSEGGANVLAYYGDTKLAQVRIQVVAPATEPTEPEIGPAVSVSKSGNNGSWDVGCVGNSLSFNAVAKTANGENRGVTASSSNTGVATVSTSANGSRTSVTVSFKGSGSTTITLTSDDGKASTSFTINVKGYSAQNASTPEAFAAACNYVIGMNDRSVVATGSYTVATLSDDQLTWSRAVGTGQGAASRSWSNGHSGAAVTYEGVNEEGLHIFHIHS